MKKYLLIFFLFITNACISQINLSQGMVAYYPFNGNANDNSGNGNNPVFNNASLTADRLGNPNSAYYFNGTDSYIRIPNSTSLNPSSAISICAWVKVKDFYLGPCRGNSVLMKGITENSPAYKLRLDENHYPGNYSCGPTVDITHEFFYGQGQGGAKDNNYPWVKTDQWYSVVYTYDGKTAKLYVDCVLKMSVDITGVSMVNDEDLFIGSTNLPGYPYWFNGVIDEVRIYNRAINLTEVMGYGGCCKIVNSATHDPSSICAPGTIDITNTAITTGSDAALSFSYFSDVDATVPVNNPASINTSGTYYIKGTANDVCTTVDPVTITIIARPSTPNAVVTQPTCTIATGTITVSAPDVQNTFYYSTDQTSYGNTSGIFTGLTPKSYNVTIKNVDGCISPLTSVVINSQPVTPPAPVISTVNNCDGTSTLSTTAAGTLLWNNNATTSSITVNAAGTYTVTQTINGCTSLQASTTAAPKSPLLFAIQASDITCLQKSGTIIITASNGSSPYGYSINGGSTYQTSNTFNNLLAANYVVRVKDALGCFLDAAVTIKQNNSLPDIKITNPPLVCEPGTVDLTAPAIIAGSETGLTYTFFKDVSLTTDLGNANAVKTSGIYYIKASKTDGCFTAKPVTVLIPPKSSFAISPGGTVCNNDSVQLKASGGSFYLWQPSTLNIADPFVRPAVTTTYTVKIKDSVCNDSTVLPTTVKVLSLPIIKATKSNDIDCSNNFSQLNVTGGTKYIWQPSATLNNPNIANPIAKPLNKTLYTVTGYDENGCKSADTVTVNINMNAINKSGYYMPTAFTPNNDGLNDCFGLKFWGTVTKLSFTVYNRFGEKVFYSTEPSRCCWDGTYRGVMQEVGAYVYVIQATTPCDVITRKGTVMILR